MSKFPRKLGQVVQVGIGCWPVRGHSSPLKYSLKLRNLPKFTVPNTIVESGKSCPRPARVEAGANFEESIG